MLIKFKSLTEESMLASVMSKVLLAVEHTVTNLKPLAMFADKLLSSIIPEANAFALCYERDYCESCGYDPQCDTDCRKLCYLRWCCEYQSGLECSSSYGHHSHCCSGCNTGT